MDDIREGGEGNREETSHPHTPPSPRHHLKNFLPVIVRRRGRKRDGTAVSASKMDSYQLRIFTPTNASPRGREMNKTNFAPPISHRYCCLWPPRRLVFDARGRRRRRKQRERQDSEQDGYQTFCLLLWFMSWS